MRIFVGAACPEELLPVIERCRRALEGVPGVQFLASGDLHLTIIPPWEERNPDAVVRDLAAIDAPSATLAVTEAGYGPDTGAPRLAWLWGPTTPAIDRIWLQAWRALWSQDPPRRPFPHVTFARFPEGVALPELPSLAGSGHIARIHVYESLGGARYRILGTRELL